ncbi:unnamed protein product [Allacma fusca]|uniref:Ig-like domain-containing protein n=1 Tax=Allacma fusca TaxID=39272 RepID=A0A8J2L6C0_9HEXA|nr:unnamed protein product [Allacma fusca]
MYREVIEKLVSSIQFLLVLNSLALSSTSACPTDCFCVWKGGKQKIECLNRGLRTFPGPIDPGTQVLDLTGNSFETLPPDHFMRLGLINLQKIYLSKCRLSHISPRTFRGLSNLVDLDLSYNVMREVPSGAFPDCQGLMRLILSGNPIPRIQPNAFISLESLTTLEISIAGIELIEKGAFDGLVSLEWLKLNGNKLKRISGLGSLPLGLKGIWLEDNPWECDCHLLQLRLWLAERNVPNSVEPRCVTPARLTNSSLKELSIENFACLPQLSPTTMYQKIGEGKNVTLFCKAISVPESTLEWWFNGQPLVNSSLTNLFVETSSNSVSSSVTSATSSYSGSGLSPSTNPDHYSRDSQMSNNNNNNNYQNLGIEKKSELTIFNVTGEENGTFLCVAKNPAGVATANFTVFFVRSDADSFIDGGAVTSFVASYSSALVVVVSTVGVIGVVILLVVISLVLCKCSGRCGMVRGRAGTSPGGQERCKQNPSSRSMKKDSSKDSSATTGCAGKMNRHLSEASTLTTATKSNGSVFLLSTSSELGIGDSNPDLIEGVASVSAGKRVDGDGHETTCFANNPNNFHNNSVFPPPEPSANPGGHFPPTAVYPMDYGLPKSLNVNTLVRRSPSTYNTTISIPPNYDLAKYPKEYINPTPMISCGQQIYSQHPPPGLMYGPTPTGEYFPAYMVAPDGTLIYNGSTDEYFMSSMGVAYGTGSMLVSDSSVVMTSSGAANCTCAPILEQSEEEKAAMEAETESIMSSSGTADTMTITTASVATGTTNTDDKTGMINSNNSTMEKISKQHQHQHQQQQQRRGESGMVARLQRQLKTQINESPDEGYEDESAEGTEI